MLYSVSYSLFTATALMPCANFAQERRRAREKAAHRYAQFCFAKRHTKKSDISDRIPLIASPILAHRSACKPLTDKPFSDATTCFSSRFLCFVLLFFSLRKLSLSFCLNGKDLNERFPESGQLPPLGVDGELLRGLDGPDVRHDLVELLHLLLHGLQVHVLGVAHLKGK